MLLSQVLQNGLLHARCLHEGRVCLDDNVALLQPLRNIVTRAPRVNLVLADGDLTTRSALDVILQLLKVLNGEVGHTQRADVARLLGLDECAPGAETILFAAVGCMDQHTSRNNVSLLHLIFTGQVHTGRCSQGLLQ